MSDSAKTRSNEAALQGVLSLIANKTVKAGAGEELMEWIQNLIAYLNEMLIMAYDLFNWSSPSTTQTILYVLCASALYCVVFPVKYLLLCVGCYVLTMNTVPVFYAYKIAVGVAAYLARERAESPARRRWRMLQNGVDAVIELKKGTEESEGQTDAEEKTAEAEQSSA